MVTLQLGVLDFELVQQFFVAKKNIFDFDLSTG